MTENRDHCAACGQSLAGNVVLGVDARTASADSFQRWQAVHGHCFDESATLVYGISLDDVDEHRGPGWWMRHVTAKAWGPHTDFPSALAEALAAKHAEPAANAPVHAQTSPDGHTPQPMSETTTTGGRR